MKRAPLLLVLAATLARAIAGPTIPLAEDDAASSAYKSGWKSDAGGTGLREWIQRTHQASDGDSHAGFYIAGAGLKGAAIRGKAFGLYANGARFETAAAFRALKKPLATGQTFSFLLEHRRIEKKHAGDDPGAGAIGLTLRSGGATGAVGDYNQGARFEFGCYEGAATYRIFDGETSHDTGVPLSEGGLSISLTLTSADTYDLEITTLAERQTVVLKGRRLGGATGAAIDNFCIFNRDGEASDAFFNGFQVLGADASAER